MRNDFTSLSSYDYSETSAGIDGFMVEDQAQRRPLGNIYNLATALLTIFSTF
jgi:hypothetical protein